MHVGGQKRLAFQYRLLEHEDLDIQCLGDQVKNQVRTPVRNPAHEHIVDMMGGQDVNELVGVDVHRIHHVNEIVFPVECRVTDCTCT